MQRLICLSTIAALFVVQIYLRFQSELVQDCAWFMHVADQLLHGKTLYVDIFEVNPPLGMWMMVPIVWFAENFNLDQTATINITLFSASAAVLAVCNRYLKFNSQINSSTRLLQVALLALGILFFPTIFFAEREHFMVLLFLPWVFLRLANPNQTQIGIWERVLIGVMAGAAICIKPQAIVAPALVELVIYLHRRKISEMFAPENRGAVLFTAIYASAILIYAPAFFTEMLGIGTKAYVPFFGYPLSVSLYGARWTITALIIAVAIRYRLSILKADIFFLDGLLAAAIGFAISFFIQMKGFAYQIMPADILACFAAAVGAIQLWQIERKISFHALGIITVASVLLFSLPQTAFTDLKAMDFIMQSNAPQAKSLFVASTRMIDSFPYVQKRNLIWASRLPTQWLTPYVDQKWHGGDLPQDDVVQRALDWTVTDLATFKPDIVMIDNSSTQIFVESGHFEYLKFWAHDPRFAAIWQNYKFKSNKYGFDVYVLNKP